MLERPPRTGLLALTLALLTLAGVATLPPVSGDVGDEPGTGVWAEDGTVFLDRVRESADDPDADPVDWYRVNLSAGPAQLDMLRIHVNLTKDGDERLFVWASIHDPDGALLQETKATDYTVRTAAALCHRTGVYLVRVYTYSRFDCFYRLEFEITQRANVTDGDDTLAQATFLEPPANVTGHLHGNLDPFDHYAVNLTRDTEFYEVVEVRLAPNGTPAGRHDLDLFLIVLDDGGRPREVASSTSNGSRELAFYAATREDQTVYIRCHAYGGNLSYDLNVTRYRVSDDGNNNIDLAEELAPGTSRNDTVNVTDRFDFFRVNLTGGDILWVNVTAEEYDPATRKPNFNIYLFDPQERIINWSHSYDPHERVTWEVPLGDMPADYYVLVTFHDRSPSDGIAAYGNYTINITVDHAPRLVAELPLVVQEDGELRVAVSSLVEDPEGRLVLVSPLPSGELSVLLVVDELVVMPMANYSGLASFPLMAMDHLRAVDLTVPVKVTPAADAPALAVPLPPLLLEEDTQATFDLGTLIVDGDGDPLAFELAGPDAGPLEGSGLDGANLTVVPGPDFNGNATLRVNASDGAGHTVALELTFTVQPVPDAPRVKWQHANLSVPEGLLNVAFDLLDVFTEPDGEDLAFQVELADVPGNVEVDLIVLGSDLVFDTLPDLFGTSHLVVTARDPTGLEGVATLDVHIVPVDDPPWVTSRDPMTDVALTEGDAQLFVVTATDPEGKELTYSWLLDGEVVPGEDLPRYELVTDHASQGEHLVTVLATDGNRTSWVNWTVTVENVNRPPTLTVKRPKRGQSFEEGRNIVFEAEVDDPDGELVSVQWIVDDEVIGVGAVFTTSGVGPGTHRLTVRAVDPWGSATEASLKFDVEKAGGIPSECGPMAAAAVVLSALAAAAWHRSRKR